MSALENVRLEDLEEDQQEVARLIGLANYKKLMEFYGGNYVYIPKTDKLERKDRNEQIRAEFNGYNYKQLAQKYNLTEVWIREIVSEKAQEIKTKPMEGQITFYQ